MGNGRGPCKRGSARFSSIIFIILPETLLPSLPTPLLCRTQFIYPPIIIRALVKRNSTLPEIISLGFAAIPPPSVNTEVQPISIVYFTSRGVRLALGKGNELGISGANGVW